MNYVLLALLPLSLLTYLKLARRFNIFDIPNARSSHQIVAIRGGGVVFSVAVLVWYLYNLIRGDLELSSSYQFPLGVLILAVISFIDDVKTLSASKRLPFHLVAVLLISTQLYPQWGILGVVIVSILIIGWINAFNFMDGINGITALYSSAVLAAYYLLNGQLEVIDSQLFLFLLVALFSFGYLNVRRQARTFAGDVGSVPMAFILIWMMLEFIGAGAHPTILLAFFAVYGVDAVLTILQRLFKRENIFEAHRSHLYQYLANERGINHISISFAYAVLQLTISLGWIYFVEYRLVYSIAIILLLVVIYLPLKKWASKSAKNE